MPETFLQLGLIGSPVSHSLSPKLHNFLMNALGIDGDYTALDIPPDAFLPGVDSVLDRLVQEGYRGINVTIPHKINVLSSLDTVSEEARLMGAVNTVVFEREGDTVLKKGCNTDLSGFTRSLPTTLSETLPERHVLLLGAGGSARAVVHGLMQLGAADITIAARNAEKRAAFLAEIEQVKAAHQSRTLLHSVDLQALLDTNLTAFQGIVNTTPIGMWPHTDDSPLSTTVLETLPKDAFVYDLIYRPLQTRLLEQAEALDLQAFNGLDMLIYQAIAAFELWQPQPVPDSLVPGLRQHLIAAL